MRERRTGRPAARDREFQAFVAGAAGRLLQTATLLTGEPPGDCPRARRLLTLALAHTYACWDRLRGDDPYDRTRQFLVLRFAHGAWHRSGARHLGTGHGDAVRRRGVPAVLRRRLHLEEPGTAGVLGGLKPHERVILVLRLFEGVAEDQTAALLGLPVERVRTVCDRAMATLLHPPRPARTVPTAETTGATPESAGAAAEAPAAAAEPAPTQAVPS